MNRCIVFVMGISIAVMISTSAGAVTGKWCFKWEVDYDDSGAGEDYVLTTRPARYGYVIIWSETSCNPIFDGLGFYLDSNGCTVDLPIDANCTYQFAQLTRAMRGSRDVYVLADGEPWSSTNVDGWEHEYTTSSPPDPSPPPFVAPATNDQFRIMPAIGNMLYFANTLAWEGGNDLKVSFDLDCDSNNPIETSCHHRPSGSSTSQISLTSSDYKFHVAHEMGHMIATIAGASFGGDVTGSEGMFRDPTDGAGTTCTYPADKFKHQCDSVCLNNDPHNLTSREFVGKATGEGWAQFIASAAYNDPDDVTGRFVYGYKRMMKWSHDHDGLLCYMPLPFSRACLPDWDTFSNTSSSLNYWDHPHVVPLDSGSAATEFARWIEEECNPASGTFQHYGTEWDWLNFFWNLWVDASNPISVAEIADVWDQVPNDDIAYFCCDDEDVPTVCESSCNADCMTEWPLSDLRKVGKLWSDDAEFCVTTSVLETAAAKWASDPDRYALFANTGAWTRVNY